MEKTEIKLIRKEEDGHGEILKDLEKISKSIFKPRYEKYGYHYYFLYVLESFYKKPSGFINEKNNNRRLLIRKIGRSCGFIELDDNDIIVSYNFYEEIGQDKKMKEILKKYIGYKVIVNIGE